MLQKLYRWYGKKMVWGFTALVIVLMSAGLVVKSLQTEPEEEVTALPIVKVGVVSELAKDDAVTLIGTVRAVSEAEIKSESAGRITTVPVTLGQTVGAGQVIATIENSRESAAVLQAEGVYDAAVAAASVSDVSVSQAELALENTKTNAVSTLQNTYTTISSSFYTTIDQYYNDPTSVLTQPKLSENNRSFLRQERLDFEKLFPVWQQSISEVTTDSDLESLIKENRAYVVRTRTIVDSFLSSLRNSNAETFYGVSVTTRIAELSALRSTLEGTIASLDASTSALKQAEESLAQARLGATNDDVSAASAQIKQALGALRAAQANYSKTVMRSPIAGTIDQLDVNVGDFVTAYTNVAKVSNNNALEISVYVGESDLSRLTVGTDVLIEQQFKGTVTAISSGINSDTKKTEVKIATETTELASGDTVTVSLVTTEPVDTYTGPIMLPIAAVKFTADTGSVFVVEDGKLKAQEVTVGAVRGALIEITAGLLPTDVIIVDVRGLTEGTEVEVTN